MSNRQYKVKMYLNPGMRNLPNSIEVNVFAFSSHEAKQIAENGNHGYRAGYITEIKERIPKKESASKMKSAASYSSREHYGSSNSENSGFGGILKGLITLASLTIALLLTNKCSGPSEETSTSLAQLPLPSTRDVSVETQDDQVRERVVDMDLPALAEGQATAAVSPAVTETTSTSRARIADSRDRIVLQSGPKMSSKNVAKIDTGTVVDVLSHEGKWVQVRTADGFVGFVRQSQLEFLD